MSSAEHLDTDQGFASMKHITVLVAIYALGVATPIAIRFMHGFIAGAIWQWREIRNAKTMIKTRRIP